MTAQDLYAQLQAQGRSSGFGNGISGDQGAAIAGARAGAGANQWRMGLSAGVGRLPLPDLLELWAIGAGGGVPSPRVGTKAGGKAAFHGVLSHPGVFWPVLNLWRSIGYEL